MPRRKSLVPGYLLHKPTGQARVRIDGRDHYLGPFGSDESRRKYGELVAARCGGDVADPLPATGPQDTGPTVGEITLAFLRHADTYYVKNGEPTGATTCFRHAVGPLVDLYGMTPARDFGPLALKAVRSAMIERGWSRRLINDYVGRIRRAFRYAVENELIPAETLHRLKALSPLLKGRTEAVESAPVLPVPEAAVNAALSKVGRQVRDMIRLQQFCGCRPSEIVRLRPCDLNRDGPVWEYIPSSHKTEHHGRERRIFFGPKAQAAISPRIRRPKNLRIHAFEPDECLRPAGAEAQYKSLRQAFVILFEHDRRVDPPNESPCLVVPVRSIERFPRAIGVENENRTGGLFLRLIRICETALDIHPVGRPPRTNKPSVPTRIKPPSQPEHQDCDRDDYSSPARVPW